MRVLNLWQKNAVFPSAVVQPLMDLAADPTNPQLITKAQKEIGEVVSEQAEVKPLPIIVSKPQEQTADIVDNGTVAAAAAAASAVPTPPSANATVTALMSEESEESAVENSNAETNDVLKAITNLISQSQQVSKIPLSRFGEIIFADIRRIYILF